MNNNAAVQITHTPSLETIKQKHKATWEDGDYANFAKYMAAGAVEVLEAWNIDNNSNLLDVGCGAGQTAIPAAKRGIRVTGVDIAENLIEHAHQRAIAEKIDTRFDVGDAENLPYSDHSYDVVISMFGAMFAPRPDQVVKEFVRILKPGGRLLMANWTPTSMPAQMFKTVAAVVPPPAGFIPPVLWGDEEIVKQRLNKDFTDIKLTRRLYPQWHYPFDADELVNLFRTHFGPVKRAFDSIDTQQADKLHDAFKAIYQENSIIENDILTITGGEYLEVAATRR